MEQRTKVLLSSLGLFACVVLLVFTAHPLRFFILTNNVQRNPSDSHSLCELGKLHYKGHGTHRDINKAFECFQRAAELNHPRAQYKLGNMYAHKCGMEKGPEADPSFWEKIPLDYEKATDYYYKAAVYENPKAFCQLGYFNFKGIGLPLNRKKSFMWYNRAAAKGSAIGPLWLGCFYSHGAGLEEGRETPIAFGDSNYKQHMLFDRWGGTELDYSKAMRCYIMAAERGCAVAQSQLGYLYSHGEVPHRESFGQEKQFPGVEKNLKKAIEWYTLSAKQGYDIAQCRLGYLYLKGLGVKQDSNAAFHWFLKAAYQGCRVAYYWIATLYEFGIGVPLDKLEAFLWYAKAAEGGDNIAAAHAHRLTHQQNIQASEN